MESLLIIPYSCYASWWSCQGTWLPCRHHGMILARFLAMIMIWSWLCSQGFPTRGIRYLPYIRLRILIPKSLCCAIENTCIRCTQLVGYIVPHCTSRTWLRSVLKKHKNSIIQIYKNQSIINLDVFCHQIWGSQNCKGAKLAQWHRKKWK